tara:strand:- start:899 stop:1474 length:576 start_codon:yes stop_codon:yes gene_type:complete
MILKPSKKTLQKRKPALFLDRDGVINVDHGYVYTKYKFDFIPGIFDLVRLAKKAGYLCVVITNQSGIGRKLYSIAQFRDLSNWMCDVFKEKGGYIDAIYFSPYHATEGKGKYLKDENTRKPGNGMFVEAIKDLNIDIDNSIMVGDKITDLKASKSANISKNYLFTNSPKFSKKDLINSQIKVIQNLKEIEL